MYFSLDSLQQPTVQSSACSDYRTSALIIGAKKQGICIVEVVTKGVCAGRWARLASSSSFLTTQ